MSQTYEKIEIIIIDDNSTDNSKQILNKYLKHPKIKVLFNKKNLGLLKSSNIAIKASKGEYIMRLDADDYLDKKIVETFVQRIVRGPKIAMVYSDYHEVNSEGKKINSIKQISSKT